MNNGGQAQRIRGRKRTTSEPCASWGGGAKPLTERSAADLKRQMRALITYASWRYQPLRSRTVRAPRSAGPPRPTAQPPTARLRCETSFDAACLTANETIVE